MMQNRRSKYGLLIPLTTAAERLAVDVELMLALDIAIVVMPDRCKMVPTWAADRLVARYVPLLSQVFRNEALAICLRHMDPLGNGTNGVDALRQGQLEPVLDDLRRIRRDFDLRRRDDRP